MRNYTLTPIYKNGEWINTWISWAKQFLLPLANDVKSLYDYWLYFSPNYEEVDYFVLKDKSNQQIKQELEEENNKVEEENKKTEEEIEKLVEENKKLLINALNYRQYVYIQENGIKAAIDRDPSDLINDDIDLPAGAIVISNVMPIGINNSDNLERQKIENYIIQYTSSADYYQYSIERQNDMTYKLIAKYIENAGEIYGNQLILQIPDYLPRFFYASEEGSYQWPKEYSGITIATFNIQNGQQNNQICDLQNLVWQPYFEIMHRTFIEKNNNQIDGEEIILDTTCESFINEIDKVAIPSYNITINNNEKQVLFEGIQVIVY